MPASVKVVDSWAMVAWIKREPSAPLIRQFLLDAESGEVDLLMSWINVAETFYVLSKRSSPTIADEFMTRLPSLPIRIDLPDQDGMMAAARIKVGLSGANEAGERDYRRCGVVPVEWVGA